MHKNLIKRDYNVLKMLLKYVIIKIQSITNTIPITKERSS